MGGVRFRPLPLDENDDDGSLPLDMGKRLRRQRAYLAAVVNRVNGLRGVPLPDVSRAVIPLRAELVDVLLRV